MLDIFFGDFTLWQIAVLAAAAVLIGINKTAIPGLGVLPVIMLTLAFHTDPAASTGLQLVMLCTTDLIALAYYHRAANWGIVAKLLPSALAGLALGSLTIHFFNEELLFLAIGIIIFGLCIISTIREIWWNDTTKIPKHWAFAVATGLAAGFSTQVANAAGPIMAIYLVSMRFEKKEELMGTTVWFFFMINWIKLPIFIFEGRVTLASLMAELPVIPFMFIGAVLGILLLKNIPRVIFDRLILAVSAAASAYIVWRALPAIL